MPGLRQGEANFRRDVERHAMDVQRSINDCILRLDSQGVINVKDYGAKGDGVTDDTAAIQAAIDTGKSVFFPDGDYAAHGLTQSANNQTMFADGLARIIKNANGALFTSSGAQCQLANLSFRGDAATPTYTGDNVVSSGVNFSMLNCGSRWAYARAVKATGGHVQIIGTCDIYQTTDATASGYDIEIGVSGTATLYHQLVNIYSSQATGGILLTDTGSQSIVGGQFGKLTLASGTSPSGVNGGQVVGARILGDVTVDLSNAVFTGNEFGSSCNLVLGSGTSGHSLGLTNVFGTGATITNNGNKSASAIVTQVGTGALSGQMWRFGDDASLAILRMDHTNGGFYFPQNINMANNTSFAVRDAADSTDALRLTVTTGNNVSLTNAVSNKSIQIQQSGASGQMQWLVNSVQQMSLTVSALTLTVKALTAASTTSGAGLNLPHGTAPTTPTNGDMWTTTAGLYVHVNGSTVGPLT